MKMTTSSVIGSVAIGGISTLALAFGSVDRAQSTTIALSLYNTGVDNAGAVLPNSTVGDPHYTLTNPNNTVVTTVSASSGYPANIYDSYATNPAPSSWLLPTGLNGITGNYTYRTTFDLTGFLENTATISGNWGTDNSGVNIFLNGVSIGNGSTNPGFNQGGYSTFNILAGSSFVAGINTLDFVVNNIDGPVALRAELSGTADVASVPEPSDMLGTAIAFGSIVMLKRKLTKKTLG
jgi:hypothetical protein